MAFVPLNSNLGNLSLTRLYTRPAKEGSATDSTTINCNVGDMLIGFYQANAGTYLNLEVTGGEVIDNSYELTLNNGYPQRVVLVKATNKSVTFTLSSDFNVYIGIFNLSV